MEKENFELIEEPEPFDLDKYFKEHETPKTLAYEMALDISFMLADVRIEQNIKDEDLAKKMGISKKKLDKILNINEKTTLLEIAMLEKALGVKLQFTFKE